MVHKSTSVLVARNVLRYLAWTLVVLLALQTLAQIGRVLTTKRGDNGQLRVALFINGTLGDKSFFDSAAKGLKTAQKDLPVFSKVIEGGIDPTRWEGALTDLADSGDFDVIVVGTFTMVPYVERLSREFPHARFVVFDATVDYAKCGCANVHSILFRQNEGAFQAGFLAATLERQGLSGLKPGGGLGVIGGMQFPVIDDFIIGFRAGAAQASPEITVLSQYANSFSDPAAGKEIAKAQFGRGVSLIFHAAGATGQGVNEAAAEVGRYAMGVDMDQYILYRDSHPQMAARIVTSVIKNVDVAILRAIKQRLENKLAFGQAISLGIAEQGISLAPYSPVLAQAPQSVAQSLNAMQTAVAQGLVIVPSAFKR
jgi:basic membrane protein A and related proteins